MIEAVIFDMDDTLYPEKDFVSSGYRAVARHLSTCYDAPYARVLDVMMSTFERDGRGRVFPAVIEQYLNGRVAVQALVEVYRRHTPEIALFPGHEQFLRSLRWQYRLGVITDGIPEVQRRKARALKLEKLVDGIVYTWDLQTEKPDPSGFLLLSNQLGVPADRAIVVGDNPAKDCRGAQAAGMKSAWCRRAGAATVEDSEADHVIGSLFELTGILEQ
jgi:putative hydrolase of the HAD superfamily